MIEPTVRQMQAYDVIVVGGGVAGIAAAVAAARGGAKTLLMEKSVILGGLATLGLISWYEPLCDGDGTKMISGIPEELIRLAVSESFDNLPVKWGGEPESAGRHSSYATRFSPTVVPLLLVEYLEKNPDNARRAIAWWAISARGSWWRPWADGSSSPQASSWTPRETPPSVIGRAFPRNWEKTT